MNNVKSLIFFSGDRGQGCDRYTVKGEIGMLVREEIPSNPTFVFWSRSLFDTAGKETRIPVPEGTRLDVLELKPKAHGEPDIMYTEYIHDLCSPTKDLDFAYVGRGLAHKEYPFSWEAQA